ncbi:ABC transporter ATP-binding protein [Polynucleobacter paneuropaeus]|nr:ABC transporter ATP-binding protein [Polynucleobacter paneuropaeus]MBT8539686.1 ABC transporter ATP-binding protein [Polynucleobacter paneuropaeus]
MGKLLRRLWAHLSPRRHTQFTFLFLLMVGSSIAEVISIGAVIPFLSVFASPEHVLNNRFIEPTARYLGVVDPIKLLLPLAIAFAVAAIVSGAMRLALVIFQTRLAHGIGADLSFDMYQRTLYQQYSVHIASNSSELIAGISNKANSVVHLVILPTIIIFSSGFLLSIILIALIMIQPLIALSAFIGFGLIYLLIVLLTHKRLLAYGTLVSKEQNKVIKALQEGLGGIRDILIDGTQAVYCKLYRDADLPLRRANSKIQTVGSAPRYVVEALGMVLIAGLAYFMASHLGGIASTIPILGALALGAQRMLPLFQQCYLSWSSIRGSQESLIDVLAILDRPMPNHSISDQGQLMPFNQSITLQNVIFQYSPNLPQVLSGINLTIPKGSVTGFIGSTGSGKSTLLDIVMGLLEPTGGHILIDGRTLSLGDARSWQRHIAHVPQSIFLSDISIAENIAFGVSAENINMAEVIKAAQKAQIHESILGFPQAYETPVGERGVRLSGGQRQRIGIARALYKKADVLVLDEATSALDNETEGAVISAIENLRNEMTILVVAHRLSTLRMCGNIVELKDGHILRQGPYDQVVLTASS